MPRPPTARTRTAGRTSAATPRAAWPGWTPAVLLVGLAMVAYLPALGNGFIWDDDDYVTANTALRSLAGLWRIWSVPGATKQYYPLTFTTFWLEYQLWGPTPVGYHIVNVLLHAANAWLVWRILLALDVPGAWLAAALFAIHPVQVESVAWITERKNTLSGTFLLAALLAYWRFSAAPSADRWRWYAVALALFVAALLGKTVTAALPAILLLLLWWKRERLWRGDLLPLLPFFLLGGGLGWLTSWVERRHVGAVGADWQLSWIERCLIAGRALWFYPATLLWPWPRVFVYPRWTIDAGAAAQYLFPLAAVAVLAALFAWRARLGKGPLVAVLCYVAALFPALGFVDVFPMRYSFVADHYVYLASIPLFALVAAAATLAPRFWRDGVLAIGLAVLLVLTWRQVPVYRDLETLWRDTIARNPAAGMAHNNLGLLLAARGDTAGAMAEYRAALAAKPDDAFALNNLGQTLARQGDLDGAAQQLRAALRSEPTNAEARNNLGNVLAAQEQLAAAAAEFRAALSSRPSYAEAHNNLANVLALQGRTDEAITHYRAALEIDPGYADARHNLAAVLGTARDGMAP